MNYNELEQHLDSLPFMPKTKPSLDRIDMAIQSLDFDFKEFKNKTILIAGTNGKGTTAKILQQILVDASYNVGFYSSPHLIHYTERYNINNQDISKDVFCELYKSSLESIEKYQLSHFEALTFMAVKYFTQQNLDFYIYEVGLGGIWDATNAIPHEHCVITNIGKDHEDILGKRPEDRLLNKLGILNERCFLYLGSYFSRTETNLNKIIKQKTSALKVCQIPQIHNIELVVERSILPKYFIKYKDHLYPMSLRGRHSYDNAEIAIRIAQEFGIHREQSLSSLKNVQWPGRFEEVQYKGKRIILSGDHNPSGIQALLRLLDESTSNYFCSILSLSEGRNFKENLLPIINYPANKYTYLTKASYRAQDFATMDMDLDTNPDKLTYIANLQNCLDESCNTNYDFILVSGSLYLIGDVKALLQQNKSEQTSP